tara:strand:+ start:1747 stop:2007 length:261 start_codon:yes stop_codon:yes gene_type:complete
MPIGVMKPKVPKKIKYQTSLEHHLHRHHRHDRNGQTKRFDRHHHFRLQEHYHQNRRLLLLNLLKSNPNKAQLAQLEKVLQVQQQLL